MRPTVKRTTICVTLSFFVILLLGCSRQYSPTVSPSAAPVAVPVSEQGDAGKLLELTCNETKLRFRFCPAGMFVMGDCDETQHLVTLSKDFWMGETEVPQEQWESVHKANALPFKKDDDAINRSSFKGAKLPVENVSWDDCQEFIGKLNAQKAAPAGYKFSLPTETQWEYACWAGNETAFCFGDDETKLGDYAWYRENSGNTTHEVGTKKPNAWNLYDMHGNVREWCQDRRNRNYVERAFRGGSWGFGTMSCRSAKRGRDVPECRRADLGVRLALVSE